jgi:hypothetical protein
VNYCKKCGRKIDYSFRYCPSCGSEAYAPLDVRDPKPESFIDLFNSLFNLLADQENAKRSEYFSTFSEKVIARRCKLDFEDAYNDIVRNLGMKFVEPSAVAELYHLTLTLTLSGYVFRSVEEIITKRRSDPLQESDRAWLMTSLFKEAGDDLNRSCYRPLAVKNDVDRRVLFCLALRWDNRHLKYQLTEDKYAHEWASIILSQNLTTCIKCHEKVFGLLMPGSNAQAITTMKHSSFEENVQEDFLFGYIVRLAESLNP